MMNLKETTLKTRLIGVSGLALAAAAAIACTTAGGDEFTSEFYIADCNFLPNGGNAYFSLHPGHFLRLEGDDDGEEVVVEITVLGETRRFSFMQDGRRIRASTRVIEEREWIDDELVEVSRNYFAACSKTGNVYYFGEDVDIYEDGKIIGHDGAWLAGVDGARPGLIMPNVFLLGARYYQEVAPDVALDRAEHVSMGLTVETPAGTFHDCIYIVETTPLEPGDESIKIYAPGVGLIVDDVVELVEFDI